MLTIIGQLCIQISFPKSKNMYIWLLDLYIIVLKIFFVLSPFLTIFIYKRKYKIIKKYKSIFLSFIFFSMFTIVLLFLQNIHINHIEDMCFDYTGYNLKITDVPSDCYLFDKSKFMGVGWPLKAMFIISYGLMYHILILIVWSIFDYVNKKNMERNGNDSHHILQSREKKTH